MATLMGSLLGELGVLPLAAHLFIFYFGMMSMVTPPVALAAYASASIAGSGIMATSMAAFRFSLVGFTLPYMFVYRPALLLMGSDGGPPELINVLWAIAAAVVGVVSLAAGLAGYLRGPLNWPSRYLLFAGAGMLLMPNIAGRGVGLALDATGAVILVALAILSAKNAPAQIAPAQN
jgi:TRAP-type uncharacterized transport system fused permease subunit